MSVSLSRQVAKRYSITPKDAKAWYATVNIKADRFISEAALERVVSTLKEAGVLDKVALVCPVCVSVSLSGGDEEREDGMCTCSQARHH